LLLFIIGIIFAICVIPILDGLIGVILSWFELLKTCLGVKMAKLSQEIHEPEVKHQIGFVVEEETEEDDI
jgi:hypothetical protein